MPLPAVLYASPLRGRSPGAQRTARVLDESGGAGWPRAAKPFHVLARPSEQNIDDVLAAMGMLKCSNMGSVFQSVSNHPCPKFQTDTYLEFREGLLSWRNSASQRRERHR